MAAPTILALDLRTTTGWAMRAHDGLITSGTVSFRPSRDDGGACATNAPTMPRIVVNTKPDGSFFPGMRNFAMTPAKKPIIIVQIIPTR